MRKALLTLLLLPIFAHADAPIINKLTLALCEGLETIHGRIQVGENKRQVFLQTSYLHSLVEDAYEASILVPSWGTREQATVKLLGSAFVESGFLSNAVHHNLNGTTDIGILQINSVHWRKEIRTESTWFKFTKTIGLDPDIRSLWTPQENFLFAAYLCQMERTQGKHGYYPYKPARPETRRLYLRLMQSIKD